jgi:hypothetical protein
VRELDFSFNSVSVKVDYDGFGNFRLISHFDASFLSISQTAGGSCKRKNVNQKAS